MGFPDDTPTVRKFDTQDDEVEVVASESYFGEAIVLMRRKASGTPEAAKVPAEATEREQA